MHRVEHGRRQETNELAGATTYDALDKCIRHELTVLVSLPRLGISSTHCSQHHRHHQRLQHQCRLHKGRTVRDRKRRAWLANRVSARHGAQPLPYLHEGHLRGLSRCLTHESIVHGAWRRHSAWLTTCCTHRGEYRPAPVRWSTSTTTAATAVSGMTSTTGVGSGGLTTAEAPSPTPCGPQQ